MTRTRIGLTLLVLTIFTFYINVYIFSPETGFFPALKSEFVYNELQEIFIVTLYLLASVYLYIEKDNLSEFYFDRTGVILLIVSSLFALLQVRLLYFLVIVASVIWMSYITVTNWSNIKKTSWVWVSASVFYTLLITVPATIFILISIKNNPVVFDKSIPSIMSVFVFHIGLYGAREEFLFRGMLWGYLNRLGLPIKYSFMIQFTLFWLLHYKGASSDAGFFIFLPLSIFTFSLLAYKSKQSTPSIVSHALYNTLSSLLWRFFV